MKTRQTASEPLPASYLFAPVATRVVYALYDSLSLLGAKSDLLCAVGSFGDTLPDEMVLEMIESWNRDHLKVCDDTMKLPSPRGVVVRASSCKCFIKGGDDTNISNQECSPPELPGAGITTDLPSVDCIVVLLGPGQHVRLDNSNATVVIELDEVTILNGADDRVVISHGGGGGSVSWANVQTHTQEGRE